MEVGHSIACVRSSEIVVAVLLALVPAKVFILASALLGALPSTGAGAGGVFAG